MKVINRLFQNKMWMKGILGMLAGIMIFACSGFVSQAADGTVTAETAKIRASASTDSSVIGSTTKGKTVDIVGAEKDASGTVWYKVHNGNNVYGYIRSDLVQTSANITVSESTTSSSSASTDSSASSSASLDPTQPTAITQQLATVSQSSVRIRSGASTQYSTVASLPQGTSMTLIGEATDSSGTKWYQMTCSYDGKTVEGYVRSDLITLGEVIGSEEGEGETAAEGEEGSTENGEETAAEPEPEAEPEHNDYEVVYNEGEYWLYINTDGTMMKVPELLSAISTANENMTSLESESQTQKIIIIILAVLLVLLVIAVTVMIFKIRELSYDYDYEGDEEEEEEIQEEPEPAPVRRKKRRVEEVEEEPESEEPVRRKRPAVREEAALSGEKTEKRRPAKETELQAAEKKPAAKKPASRKAQNFLLDDDEFEFEFLNMDDKDL